MRWLAGFWGFPIIFLGGWYSLSYYDINFGIFMLSREANDMVFRIYGDILGVPPETLPPLVARTIVFDSFVVLGIYLFGRRKQIIAWWKARQSSAPVTDLASNDNLSSAP